MLLLSSEEWQKWRFVLLQAAVVFGTRTATQLLDSMPQEGAETAVEVEVVGAPRGESESGPMSMFRFFFLVDGVAHVLQTRVRGLGEGGWEKLLVATCTDVAGWIDKLVGLLEDLDDLELCGGADEV